jgi:hypothetical protein
MLQAIHGQSFRKYRSRHPAAAPAGSALGFRHFLLRGREQVSREWTLVTLAYNLKRLHHLETAHQKI